MTRQYGRATWWGAGLIFTLLFLILAPGASFGKVVGSRHDFSSSTIVGQGPCSACHLPHGGRGALVWKRDLADEAAYYIPTFDPNYVPGQTLLCYDCHDDMLTVPDREPPDGIWVLAKPQDIAFSATPADALRWNSPVGYYELAKGEDPRTGTPPKSTDVNVITGGHYWQTEPTGVPDYRRADKIACSLCHDPHKGLAISNDVFFRFNTPNGEGGTVTLGDGLKASPNSRNYQVGGTGREMCAKCHSYSDSGTPVRLWSVNLPKPPAVLDQHRTDDTTPCTNCHKHNKIMVRCDDCHGYPPTTVGDGWSGPGDTDENYPGGAGAHLAHIKGVGKTAADPDKYTFGCLGGACHPSNLHDQGSGIVARANVQVAFSAAWNPNGLFSSGGSPGSDSCSRLYCHSNGLVENGANTGDNGTGEAGRSGSGEYAESSGHTTFYGTTPAKPATWGGSLDCKGCHGKGAPNYLRDGGTLPGGSTANIAVSPPDYLNAGWHNIAGDNLNSIYNNTGANTHFIHVYKIPFSNDGGCICHGPEAPGVAPAKHVNRQNDITYCSFQCHNTTSSYTWGGKFGTSGGQNSCAWWCHGIQSADAPGGRVNKSTFYPSDTNLGFMETGHGLPSTSTYSSGNPGAGLACEDCHLATDRLSANGSIEQSYHYERMRTATGNPSAPLSTNPYWLKAPYSNNPDGLCEFCHDPRKYPTLPNATDARNHTAQGMIDNADYSPRYDSGVAGTWNSFTPKCVSCHDPHGEPNWFMIYDGNPEKSTNAQELAYSGPVIYKGSRYGVTVAQSDQYGFPLSYPANQTPVAMSGNTLPSHFVNGSNNGICQVCHTLTSYFRRDGSNPGGTHISTITCNNCHTHPESFGARCEGCHGLNPTTYKGCNLSDPADDAPNVMGNGTNPIGAGGMGKPAKPFDDGTWGYNVNGHGANGSRISLLTPNLKCTECHDLGNPTPSTHFDCSVNTRFTFGNPDTRNVNTSHLRSEYLAGANNPQSKQIGFDDYCYNTCHRTGGVPEKVDPMNMRHGTKNAAGDWDEIMQFNTAFDTTDDPKQDRGADNVWTPWTIDDLTNVSGVDATPPTVRHHGVCVSCHNPHGTSTLQKTRGTNHMVIRNWQDTAMPAFCGSNCHKIP